jgi:hypothetical protein
VTLVCAGLLCKENQNMSKLTIKNESTLPDRTVIKCVMSVMADGLISNGANGEQYCFATKFKSVMVYAAKTKTGTHVFRVISA